jgi:ABC-type sugar transport system substrate-binding protein
MITKSRRAATGGLVLTALGALTLSACGSDSQAGEKKLSSADTTACVDKANKFLEDWKDFPTTLPASPPARYTTLPEKPPTGKTIVYVRQNFPAAASTFAGIEESAKALGWTAKSVIFDNTLPDFLAKVDSAIASKPDFLTWSGFPAAAAQKQIEAAKAAGINVVISATTDQPVSSPGLAGVGNGTETAKKVAQIHANMALATSNCTAHTVIFSLDYPIIDVSDQEYTRVVKESCPACTVQVVKIQAKDIGTPAATQQMVAKLQADPSTKYAYTVIGDLSSGLAQALKTAGIDDVKIFGQVPNENSIAALRDGTNAWWVNQASAINGMDTVDMAARVAVTGEVQNDSGGYPLALLTPDNVPAGQDKPVIPENIADLYAQTWGVG